MSFAFKNLRRNLKSQRDDFQYVDGNGQTECMAEQSEQLAGGGGGGEQIESQANGGIEALHERKTDS